MIARRLSIRLFGALTLALAGCSDGSGTSGGGGAGGSSVTGGGGAGGATTTSSSTTTTSTMTAPLTCDESVTKPAIQNGECDLLQQDCPSGQTCRPTDDGMSTFCRKEGGLKGAGKPCEKGAGIQECQAGLYCVGPSEGLGFCTRPCCPSNDEPCGGGYCNVEVDFGAGLTVFMCSYAEQCDLFVPGECKNGQKCQFVYANQGLAVCTLQSENAVPEGEACGYVNECPEMAVCYAGLCRYSCAMNSSAQPGLGGCPAGQSCVAIYPNSPDLGVCQPPM